MTILVTGATGTIGSGVVRRLQEEGERVRAFVRDPAKAAAMFGDSVEIANGDFAEPESVRIAVKGADAVFLACGNVPDQVPYETTVIDAASAAGVDRIVKLSSIGAATGAPLAFWDWHGRIEDHLRDCGVPSVVLHASYYMSNVFAAAKSVREANAIYLPLGGARVAMVCPQDVAACAAVALRGGYDGTTRVLTGPAAITFDDVAGALSDATGRQISFVPVPDEGARQAMTGAGLPEWLVDSLLVLFGLLREGAAAEVTGDVRTMTGREPRSFADFARDAAPVFA